MKAAILALAAAASSAYADAGHHEHFKYHLKARGTQSFQSGLIQDPPKTNQRVLVPTPDVFRLNAPGDVTTCHPNTAITLTSPTTAPAATTLDITSNGEYTYGGVTTSVPASTTVTAVYATDIPALSSDVTLLLTATHTCPTAGVYTIGAYTESYNQSTVVVYPTVAVYPAGTYTQSLELFTATKSDEVFFCPYATPTSSTSSSSSTPPPPPPTSSTSSPPPPPPSPPPSPTPSPPPVVSAAAFANLPSSSAVPSASASASAPPPKIGTGSGPWCMTYSPYQNDGSCKGASDVASDVAKIASMGFNTIRIYSTDCNGLQNVGTAARSHGIKMIVGIFIDQEGIDASRPQIQALLSWGQWDLVDMVVVGNEAVFSGYTTAPALAAYISEVKSTIGNNFKGPYTTSETVNIWQASNGAFCGAVDVLGSNIHPFFNAGTSADQAGTFITTQLQLLGAVCSGLATYNLETGWPHAGNANGAAVPGITEQQTALKSIMAAAGGKSAFFSFVDDEWKDPGPYNVEQTFGCSENWPFSQS